MHMTSDSWKPPIVILHESGHANCNFRVLELKKKKQKNCGSRPQIMNKLWFINKLQLQYSIALFFFPKQDSKGEMEGENCTSLPPRTAAMFQPTSNTKQHLQIHGHSNTGHNKSPLTTARRLFHPCQQTNKENMSDKKEKTRAKNNFPQNWHKEGKNRKSCQAGFALRKVSEDYVSGRTLCQAYFRRNLHGSHMNGLIVDLATLSEKQKWPLRSFGGGSSRSFPSCTVDSLSSNSHMSPLG